MYGRACSMNSIINKKAQTQHLADLFLTVVLGALVLLVVGFMFNAALSTRESKTLTTTVEFRRMDSAISNLRSKVLAGEDITPGAVDSLIEQSKVLGGKIITTCSDYFTAEDCNLDAVQIGLGSVVSCRWEKKTKSCTTVVRGDLR